MTPDFKRHLVSFAVTFLSTFTLVFATGLDTQLATGYGVTSDILMTILVSAGVAGARAVLKIIIETPGGYQGKK